ncbi:MAG: indolepyruvate ferredoxin oxidoreductase family protein, partial [Rhodospirillales bacterium]|nr:indolepyruvate ferredoxin oxidoreductase family protein [Rhodospirillales bacterium]
MDQKVTTSPVTLDDRYSLASGKAYMSGTQALLRLLLEQAWRDKAAGLNTAGFVSGYRGSPLGGFDLQLWKAQKYLQEDGIHFEPGLNEELAVTAVWGSQQTDIFGSEKYDGVFGLWYGKTPGLDRSGDAFKHANMNGTSRYGG